MGPGHLDVGVAHEDDLGPAGGEVEYGADCDQVDEHWRPRVWGATFAAFHWVHNQPEFLRAKEPEWDVTWATPESTWKVS